VAHVIHIGRMTHADLGTSFALAAPKILRFREKNEPPFIAKLYRPMRKTEFRVLPGELRMALTEKDWLGGSRSLGDQ
jgi:hypothetical protein